MPPGSSSARAYPIDAKQSVNVDAAIAAPIDRITLSLLDRLDFLDLPTASRPSQREREG
jgi:hypothetical protein